MSSRVPATVWIGIAVLIAAVGAGCDQGSAVREAPGRAPLVSDLAVQPDSVNAADVPDARVQDSLARIGLRIQVHVADPDGEVERVPFTIEPASSPRGTASGTLQRQNDSLYAREVGLRVPVFLTEVYTVRVFAVDDDSLASNQGVGQFQFVARP
jgi:hypothetical protein